MTPALLAVLTLAASVSGWSPCNSILGTQPVIEVAEQEGRASLSLYAIGFSRSGNLAWLERRQGFDDDRYTWSIHIQALATDRSLDEQTFSTKLSSLDVFCGKYSGTVARFLDKYEIEAGHAISLEQPDLTQDPLAVELRSGRRDFESGTTQYEVLLHGRTGLKSIGVVTQVDVDSGDSPVSAPRLLGLLRSPFERRVAILLVQSMIGIEGVEVTLVKVFGGHLDRGWASRN